MNEAVIALRQIDFAYPAAPPVFSQFDFSLMAGERIALTGHNGCGKSTLLHLITGLLRPQSGEIYAFATPRRRESDFKDLRRKVGYLLQDSDDQLFCPTVLDDVMFGPLNFGLTTAAAQVRALRVLADLGLGAYRDRVTYKLSGGEKRLVALATVLAMEPAVLLLDEPTAGLDGPTEARLIGILQQLPQDMIIASHNEPFVAALATRSIAFDSRVRLATTP